MRTITNHVPRHLVYASDVPPAVMADRFDYHLDMPEDERPPDGYFKYRGNWYHLDEFMRFEGPSEWDGHAADSFYSAVVIKIVDDGESVICGLQLA